ncbi:MAG: hypothetical protein ACP5K9_01365 [Candidatus Micrarchaeia archaeon]
MADKTKSYCIICGQEKDGIEIESDYVIDAIRWFKRNVTKNEQRNRIVVCKDCYPKYKILRKRFEKREKIYIILGILFIITGTVISPRIGTFIVTVIVAVFLYLLSLLSYIPKIKLGQHLAIPPKETKGRVHSKQSQAANDKAIK